MALVKVLSEQTEAEIVTTLRQLQVALASSQELMEHADARIISILDRADRLLGKLEQAAVALGAADA